MLYPPITNNASLITVQERTTAIHALKVMVSVAALVKAAKWNTSITSSKEFPAEPALSALVPPQTPTAGTRFTNYTEAEAQPWPPPAKT